MKKEHYLSQKDYDKVISLAVRFCIDLVVVRRQEVLLSKRLIEPFKGFWHLPGGMVRKGETIKEAAERILESEIGLKILSMQLAGYIEYLNEKRSRKQIFAHSVSLVFKIIPKKGKLKGSFQARDIRFFSGIPENIIPEVEKFLKKNWNRLIF